MTQENETTVEETTQTNDSEAEETTEQEEQAEETIEQKIARLEKENHTLKIQKGKMKAKAERQTEEQEEKKTVEGYSLKDLRALDGVHDDDVEAVERFAKANGVSLAEARKDDDLIAILEARTERRKVADATNTGNSKPTHTDQSDDVLRAKAKKNFGSLTDDEIERYAKL